MQGSCVIDGRWHSIRNSPNDLHDSWQNCLDYTAIYERIHATLHGASPDPDHPLPGPDKPDPSIDRLAGILNANAPEYRKSITGALSVLPIALAWRTVFQECGYYNVRLNQNLYVRDVHDNLWGRYIGACLFYSMITKEKFDGRRFLGEAKSAGGLLRSQRGLAAPPFQTIGRVTSRMSPGARTSNAAISPTAPTELKLGTPVKPPTVNLGLTAHTFTKRITSDKKGRLVRTEVMGTDSAGYVETPVYDAEGRVIEEVTSDGAYKFAPRPHAGQESPDDRDQPHRRKDMDGRRS